MLSTCKTPCPQADDGNRTHDLLITNAQKNKYFFQWRMSSGILYPIAVSDCDTKQEVMLRHGDYVKVGSFYGIIDLTQSIAGKSLGVLIKIDSSDGRGDSILLPLKAGMQISF